MNTKRSNVACRFLQSMIGLGIVYPDVEDTFKTSVPAMSEAAIELLKRKG